jgi:uncharacterized HAD superfamily protein
MPQIAERSIGCDLDGVIGDIVRQLIRFSRLEHQIYITRNHVISENVETCAPIQSEQLHRLFQNPEFFRSLPLLPHSRRALTELAAAGCSIHIVTDRFWYEGIQQDTRAWLEQHRIPFNSLTFSRKSEKNLVAEKLKISWFIEDQLSNALLLASSCRVLLIDRPYNQGGGLPADVIRVRSLPAAVEMISKAIHSPENSGRVAS